MTTLVEFLTARLDEDERIALGVRAELLGEGMPLTEGEHWRWVHRGDWHPDQPGHTLVDQPVDLDRWEGQEAIGVNGPDYAGEVSLRSVDDYPTTSVGPLPRSLIGHAEDVDVTAARHIVRHDPARVLAEVAAKRALVEKLADREDWAMLRLLTAPYADHPDCDPTWRPTP